METKPPSTNDWRRNRSAYPNTCQPLRWTTYAFPFPQSSCRQSAETNTGEEQEKAPPSPR